MSSGTPDSGLLTVKDVAELVRTSPVQVRHMARRGQLPAPKKIPGLGLRWAAEVMKSWMAASLAGDAEPA